MAGCGVRPHPAYYLGASPNLSTAAGMGCSLPTSANLALQLGKDTPMRTKSRSSLATTASMLALSLCLGAGLGISAALADDGHGGGLHPHVQMKGVADIVRAPNDLPPPLAKRGP